MLYIGWNDVLLSFLRGIYEMFLANGFGALITERRLFLVAALACLALLGFGYYLQFMRGLDPCPLCILQRGAYLGVGLVCLIAFLHGSGARLYSGLALVCALTGAAIAGRQVWLQQLPPERAPECGPGLDFILHAFPLFDALRLIFTGSGECAQTVWTFLSLSIAEWSLFWFAALSALFIYQTCSGRPRHSRASGNPV